MMENKKIAMAVYNSVSHDARVLKEAESLVNAGYGVRIFGIVDNRQSAPFEQLDNGVEIERVDVRSLRYQMESWLLIIQASAVLLLINFLFTVIYINLGLIFDFINQNLTMTIFAIVNVYIAYLFLKRFIVLRRFVKSNNGEKASAKKGISIRGGLKKIINIAFNQLKVIRSLISFQAFSKKAFANISAYHPDVIHCHDLSALPAGVNYKKNYPVTLVYDSHEIYEEQASFGRVQKKIFYYFQKHYARFVDAFITINESIADFLTNRYPTLKNPVIIKNATKPNAGDIDYDGRLHDAAELNQDVKILLYQGGFGSKRGLDVLVKSAGLLPEGWVLVMMGWGRIEDLLKKIASNNGTLGNKVRFIPPVPHAELTYWTAGASLGVIPYENVNLNHWFCTPNKLWEYPNANVPLLVSPFPEMEKIVKTYNNGWLLADPLTPEGIAQAVGEINDEELIKAKQKSLEFVQQDNWDLYQKKLIDMYESIDYSS